VKLQSEYPALKELLASGSQLVLHQGGRNLLVR